MTHGSSGSPSDRRRHKRADIRGAAAVRVHGGKLEGEAVDISRGGVCLTLPGPLQLGAVYNVDIRVGAAPELETSVMGRVCFCIEQSEGYRIGMSCPLEAQFADSIDLDG